jgi:protocatechuate 3,4-dioxygenase beta subunit
MTNARRSLIIGLSRLAALGVAMAAPIPALADRLRATRAMALGPFYPVEKPSETDPDLTRILGQKDRARGEIVEVTGRVLTEDGAPIPGAKIEVWQANAVGRYHHHADDNVRAPIDPGFQGYATFASDAAGRYRFLTVRPAPYPAGEFMRAAHIHFDVEGKYQRLITQMYFPADAAMLRQDRVFLNDVGGPKDTYPPEVFGRLTPGGSSLEKGALLCEWDIVLWAG